jgi:hypothetical protein
MALRLERLKEEERRKKDEERRKQMFIKLFQQVPDVPDVYD